MISLFLTADSSQPLELSSYNSGYHVLSHDMMSIFEVKEYRESWLSWPRKKNSKKELNVVVANGYQPVNSSWCPKSPQLTSDKILLFSDESVLTGEDRKEKYYS